MSLTGNLRTMDLPEVLQWIAGGRKTGTLHLDRGAVQKRIAFVHGIIDTSWSNDPRESLGQFLVRDALVTEEQLFKALLRQETEGRLIGVILVGDGAVSEDDLRRALQLKVGETIYDLFLWPEGNFRFKDGELPQPSGISVDLPVMGVIMEGARRIDEWSRIRTVFPTAGTSFTRDEGHSRRPHRPRGTEVPRPSPTPAARWPPSPWRPGARSSTPRPGPSISTSAACSPWPRSTTPCRWATPPASSASF